MRLRRALQACVVVFLLAVPALSFAQSSFEQLLKAVNTGDTKTVGALLDKGLEPNTADPEGNTILMLAARGGDQEIVALLIDRKASVTRRSAHGDTALMFACLKGHLPIAKLLVANGAQVKQNGWAPLHYAVFEGRTEVVKFLLEKGADKNGLAPNGFTPLMLAARGGHLETARVLLYEDVDLYTKGPKGETALAIATQRKSEELVTLLRRAGALE